MIQMDDDLGFGEYFLHGVVAGRGHYGVVGHAGAGLARDAGIVLIPEHSVGSLIAHLHPFRGDALIFKGCEHFACVALDGPAELFEAVVSPSLRFVLLGRIGPPVAVVEVYHDSHAQVAGNLSFGYYILHSAPALGRVYPYPVADGVESELLHQGGALALLTGGVVELDAVIGHFGGPAYVGALCERSRLRCLRLLFFLSVSVVVAGGCQREGCGHHCKM